MMNKALDKKLWLLMDNEDPVPTDLFPQVYVYIDSGYSNIEINILARMQEEFEEGNLYFRNITEDYLARCDFELNGTPHEYTEEEIAEMNQTLIEMSREYIPYRENR